MNKKKRELVTGAVLVILAAGFFFSSTPAWAQKEGGTLRYPVNAEPRPLDPQHWYSEKVSNIICQHIYENLIGIDKEFKIVPELATSWKISPDQKSWTFTLRKGVKFHDGTPFDAKSIEANFSRFTKDKPNAWTLVQSWFKSIDVLDDYTVRINLTKVYTPFLTEMAQIYTRIMSPQSIRQYGMDLGQHPSGTGPWKFDEWIPGDRLTLKKNAEYWKGKPRVDEIVFKFTPDMTARMMGFESGSFDVLDQPQYVDIERLISSKKYESHSQASSELFHLAFNYVAEPVSQKAVRQAITYAINKDQIVKSLLGENVIVANSFGPVYLKETLVKKDAYRFNVAKAKEILKNAGWKPGADGVLVKDGKRLQFKIMTPMGRYPMDRQIAEAVQANLKQVGMDAALEVVESAAFIKWLRAPEAEMKGSGIGLICRTRPLGASLDFAFVQHYHSQFYPPTGANSGYFSNKSLDELLSSAVSVPDDKKRSDMYRKAQEILFDELPVIPMYFYRNFMFNQPYVKKIDLFAPAYVPAPFVSHETYIEK
jgi:ABC-type transport system substrate-binding protein